jgi:hypothetical protein
MSLCPKAEGVIKEKKEKNNISSFFILAWFLLAKIQKSLENITISQTFFHGIT